MHKLCEKTSNRKRFVSNVWNWIKNLLATASDKVKRCKAAGDIYYNSVNYFGHANFEKVSPGWCTAFTCAKGLGDPSVVLSG